MQRASVLIFYHKYDIIKRAVGNYLVEEAKMRTLQKILLYSLATVGAVTVVTTAALVALSYSTISTDE